jgi:hypothetical protein
MTASRSNSTGETTWERWRSDVMITWRPHVMAALPAWIVARVVVAMAYVAAQVLPDFLRPGTKALPSLSDGLYAWDGDWYRRLITTGYGAVPNEGRRFFPLLPALGRVVHVVTGAGPMVMLVVVNITALLAMAALHRLVFALSAAGAFGSSVPATTRAVSSASSSSSASGTTETAETAQVANSAVRFMAYAPVGFALVWLYAEAPMMLAVALTFQAVLDRRWRRAGGWALVASLLRPVGVVLIVVALVSWWRTRERGTAWLLLGPTVGGALVLLHAHIATGDWWAPVGEQTPLRGDVVEPLTRTVRAITQLVGGSHRFDDGLHAPFAVGALILVVIAVRLLPLELALYGAAVTLLALAADNLNSLERYIGSCIPLIIAAAFALRRWPQLARAVSEVSLVMMTLLAVLAWSGVFVP